MGKSNAGPRSDRMSFCLWRSGERRSPCLWRDGESTRRLSFRRVSGGLGPRRSPLHVREGVRNELALFRDRRARGVGPTDPPRNFGLTVLSARACSAEMSPRRSTSPIMLGANPSVQDATSTGIARRTRHSPSCRMVRRGWQELCVAAGGDWGAVCAHSTRPQGGSAAEGGSPNLPPTRSALWIRASTPDSQ